MSPGLSVDELIEKADGFAGFSWPSPPPLPPLSSPPLPSALLLRCRLTCPWYGNIQYILNLFVASAASYFLFLFVELRSDHHHFPCPFALVAKLLAVYHVTATQIAFHYGIDAAQFLLIKRANLTVLLAVTLFALTITLPLNLFIGSTPLAD